MKSKISFLLILLIFTAFTSTFAEIVTVEGYGNNKQEALEDAYRTALEEVAGVEITAVTKVENFQTIESYAYTRFKGYIKLIKILSEGWDDSGFYKVVVKVDVEKERILMKLKDLMVEAGEPTVGLVIKETFKSSSDEKCSYTATPMFLNSAGLKKMLRENGLKLKGLSVISEYNKILKKEGVGKEDLINLSLAAKDIASYIIFFDVIYQSRYVPDYDVCSVRMNLEVSLVRSDTGKVVESYGFSEVAAGGTPEAAINRILKKVLNKLTEDISEAIYTDRVVKALSPKNIRVRFNLTNPEMITGIKECIFYNIESAMKISILTKMSTALIFSVLTYKTPENLWEEIKSATCMSENYDFELKAISGDLVEIDIKGELKKGETEIYLKFDLESYSLLSKLKKFLYSINGLEILGKVSLKPYTLKVKYPGDVEELLEIISSCENLQIEPIDIAEDGSWILFEVKWR